MKISNNLDKRNSLRSLLLQVSEHVNLFSNRDVSASSKWLVWLNNAESVLKEYNYPECAQLSGLRSSILSSQHYPNTATSHRKQIDEACIATINPAQQILSNIYDVLNVKVENAYSFFRQVIVTMKSKNLINLDGVTDMTDYINNLLRQLSLNEQLSTGINGIIASIGKADAVRVIADVLTEKV